MEPITRRNALVLGGVGAAAIIAGGTGLTWAWNSGPGHAAGPALAGDRIAVSLENRLLSATNLHTHGLHVSPQGNSDNPLVMIRPGETFDYEFQLPDSHPAGVYWYHPHHHGLTADQVFGGLYGAIIVEDSAPIETTRERILIISDMSFDSSGQIARATHMDRMAGREGGPGQRTGQPGTDCEAGRSGAVASDQRLHVTLREAST